MVVNVNEDMAILGPDQDYVPGESACLELPEEKCCHSAHFATQFLTQDNFSQSLLLPTGGYIIHSDSAPVMDRMRPI